MKPLSVLSVDTNKYALKELGDLLEYLGHEEISQAGSANSAWSMMRVKEYDCIIAEWNMPDMTGLALLKVVRNDNELYNTPFYLTDSAFTKVKVVQAGHAGVTGLIVRPFDVDNLKSKIANLAEYVPEESMVEAEASLEEGLNLIESNNFDEALDVFNKLVADGETAEHYYNIGYIKTAQGEYAEAIQAFRKATQLDRLFAKAYEAMGRALRKLGKAGEAEKCLQKAADIYMSKEQTGDAEELLNEILEIGADSINVYNSLGVLYRKKGDYKKALQNYKKAIKVHPDEPYIHYNVGRLYLEMKDPRSAKDSFAAALKIKPDFKEAKEIFDAIQLGSL